MTSMVPDYYLYIAVLSMGMIIFMFVMKELNLRKNGEIGYIAAKAIIENRPILDITEIATSSFKWILGTYDEEGRPFWELDGVKIHFMKPDFSSGRCRPTYYKGVPVFNYATIKTNPLDRETMIALNTLSEHRTDAEIEDANEVIKHISDIDLFSLFRSPLEYLKRDCALFLPDDVINTTLKQQRLIEIYDAVREVKVHLDKIKGELGWFCKVLAFETNPFAKSAQDTERIIAEVKAEERDKWLDQERKQTMMTTFGIIAIGILGASGFAIYIVSLAVK